MSNRKVQFSHALLPDGWAENVLISIDHEGNISAIETGKTAASLQTIALPGMANVHSHAHQRAMAGLTERAGPGPDSFWTWREVMYGFLNHMTPDDLQAIAAQLYVEMLKSGFTAVGEFQYLHHAPDGTPYNQRAEMTLRCHSAAQQAGIGFTALPVLYAYGGFGAQPPTEGQKRFINHADGFAEIMAGLKKALAGDANASIGIAPHSLRAVSKDLLDEAMTKSGPVHVHIAEQKKEVSDCIDWSGRRPVDWLLENFDVNARWCAIHATHMSDEETTRLARSGAIAGLCPTTEANLGDGIFPAKAYIDAGGGVSIGSDSHISVSPAEDLRMLEYSQRLRDHGRNVLADGPDLSTGRSLFDRAAHGGAQALDRTIGTLAQGARADIICLDPGHPSLLGRTDDEILDSWIFAAGSACVQHVFVGGKQVIESGHHGQESNILKAFKATLAKLRN